MSRTFSLSQERLQRRERDQAAPAGDHAARILIRSLRSRCLQQSRLRAATNGKVGENYSRVLERTAEIETQKVLAYKVLDELELLRQSIEQAANTTREHQSHRRERKLFARAIGVRERALSQGAGTHQPDIRQIDEAVVESSRLNAMLKASPAQHHLFSSSPSFGSHHHHSPSSPLSGSSLPMRFI